jgi:hypothetical protein
MILWPCVIRHTIVMKKMTISLNYRIERLKRNAKWYIISVEVGQSGVKWGMSETLVLL